MNGVCILIPSFNRGKFSQLIEANIKAQTYPCIDCIIIADDSTDPHQTIELDVPCEIVYLRVSRMTIGMKRNLLLKRALETTCEWFCFYDTDDIYFDSFISTSIFMMCANGRDVSGSSDMLLVRGDEVHSQSCLWFDHINEATLCCHRSYAETHFFGDVSSSEGLSFIEPSKLVEVPIERIMLCVVHDSNTVPKEVWMKNQIKFDMGRCKSQLDILRGIV
jgi:glycosyltransferase involved in cell wall biosynthesis